MAMALRLLLPVAAARRPLVAGTLGAPFRRMPMLQARAPLPVVAMAAAPSAGGEQQQPRKKIRVNKYFEFRVRRPEKEPSYYIWAGLVFAFLMRRTILEEILRWPFFAMQFAAYARAAERYIVKFLYTNAKEPFLWAVTLVSWAGMFATDLFHFLAEVTPVRVLITSIVLCSAVLSLGEAVRKDAANQPWILGLATVAGLGAVLEFWQSSIMVLGLLLSTIISLARHRDLVTGLLPAAAVLVGVGVPQVQVVTFVTYLLVAMLTNWLAAEARDKETQRKAKSPFILVVCSLMVGVNIVVNWLQARHIVWLAAP